MSDGAGANGDQPRRPIALSVGEEDNGRALENQGENSSQGGHGEQPPIAPVAPENSAPHSQHAQTEREDQPSDPKEQLDRAMVRWTRVLAFFTGALVLTAVLQFWAMYRQLNEMTAARIGGDKSFSEQMGVLKSQTDAAVKSASAAKIAADAAKQLAEATSGQLEEMKISGRAWIGSDGAALDGGIAVGSDVKLNVAIQDTGKEPGRNFSVARIADSPYIAATNAITLGAYNEAFATSAKTCLASPSANGGGIIYPLANGFSGTSYVSKVVLDKTNVTPELLAGNATIVVQGCITYVTTGIVKASAYCFLYNTKIGSPNLIFCATGNDGN